MSDGLDTVPVTCVEQLEVWRRRYAEALEAGLTNLEAGLFAESLSDIGELRRLVELGCPPEQIALILI